MESGFDLQCTAEAGSGALVCVAVHVAFHCAAAFSASARVVARLMTEAVWILLYLLSECVSLTTRPKVPALRFLWSTPPFLRLK